MLIGFVTTGPWSLVHKQGPPRSHIMIRSSLKSHDCILWYPATCMVSLFLTVITMMSLPFVPKRELSRRAQKYQLLVQIYQLLSLLQAGQKRETWIERIESLVGSKGGPVMNAFASHHHSNPGVMWVLKVCCWFSPLLQEVLLWLLRFSPLLKNQHLQIPVRPGIG